MLNLEHMRSFTRIPYKRMETWDPKLAGFHKEMPGVALASKPTFSFVKIDTFGVPIKGHIYVSLQRILTKLRIFLKFCRIN